MCASQALFGERFAIRDRMVELVKNVVSTVIMAHPARRQQAEQLQRRYPGLDIEIVFDPEPKRGGTTLPTARLAWQRIKDGATHQLVLQDDVQLCRNFCEVLEQALSVAPAGAISLHVSWEKSTAQSARIAALIGASWVPIVDPLTPTQALLLPVAAARQFASFAARYSDDTPDNRVMAKFLSTLGIESYAAVPNLAQHRPVQSLLLNDLLYGVRDAAVFPESGELGQWKACDRVAAPPAVAHLGLGDWEGISHYEPLLPGKSEPLETHIALIQYGMSVAELQEGFTSDLDYHLEARSDGLAESILFHMWITMFMQGHIARGMLTGVEQGDFDRMLVANQWARGALGTFAASALRRMYSRSAILSMAKRLTPLCITAMRSGFAAVDSWPDLSALWHPDEHVLRPRWKAGETFAEDAD
jgi:hypothetical protein